MMKFNHKSGNYIRYKCADIYYEIINDSNKPVLLFLHGGGHSITEFNPIILQLNKAFKIIGIDSRGHGKSTIGEIPLSYRLLQHEIEFTLKKLNINKLSIIGFSNGGTLAYRLAAFSNISIDKLITISSPWHLKYIQPMFNAYRALEYDWWNKMEPLWYEEYKKINPQPDHMKLFYSLKELALDGSEAGWPNESVKNITCPVLAIHGENDALVSLESMKSLKKNIKK